MNDASMQAPSMYAKILGEEYAGLPRVLRCLHDRKGATRYRGEVTVTRGRNLFARLCAAATRLPPTHAQAPIEVHIVAESDGEQWTRFFGTHAMRSRLNLHGRRLREYLGLLRFDFALSVVEHTIVWKVVAVRALGVALPAHWFAGVNACEFEQEGRYGFNVSAALPLVGLIVRYFGWLDVD